MRTGAIAYRPRRKWPRPSSSPAPAPAIGRALALELAGRGYDLFLTARRTEALEAVRADIAAAHPTRRVEIRRLDVTDDAAVAAALAEAADRFGRCDIVVANAGLGNSGRIGEGNVERGRAIVETNLIGAIATVDAAVGAVPAPGWRPGRRHRVGGRCSGTARVRLLQRIEGRARGVPRVRSGGDLPGADHRDHARAWLHRHAAQQGHEEPPVPDRRREGRAARWRT